MQVFKCALQIIRANILFFLIYIVGLSFMAIMISGSFDTGADPEEPFVREYGEFAIVDRDGGPVADALGSHMESLGQRVRVEDDDWSMQDAVAKGAVDYMLIIPEGYSADFVNAAEEGDDIPKMESVFSYYSGVGVLMNEAVDEYLGILRTLVVAEPGLSVGELAGEASTAASTRADVDVISKEAAGGEADSLIFYAQWSMYTLFVGIAVVVGIMISIMGRAAVRRRNLASPMTYVSMNSQLALACVFVALVACAWSFLAGVVFCGEAAAAVSAEGLLLMALCMLVYSLMAASFGYMLGQFGASATGCNAIVNIVGLVIAFLGGGWIPLSLMGPELNLFAHWLPGAWYGDACLEASRVGLAGGDLGAVLADLGVVALFAVAFLLVGFVVARNRMQTSEAGGNA